MEWVIVGLKVKKLRVSIRSKLLLVSAVLFVVPWIGVKYIQDMESFLRVSQEENLLDKAQIVAAVLQGQAELFSSRTFSGVENETPKIAADYASHIYVRPIKRAIQLDGYLDDWLDYSAKAKLLTSSNPASFQYKYYLASYKRYIYMVLEIKDDKLVYRKANSLSLNKSDHVILKLRDKEGVLNTYFITTQSPGWVNAHRMKLVQNEWQSIAPELRIKGEWQETSEGYNVEIRVPLSLIGDGFSFFVADVDDKKSREIITTLGEGAITETLGSIIIPSVNVEQMLNRIVRPASRTWVVDQSYRVLAVAGDIKNNTIAREYSGAEKEAGVMSRLISVFYHLLLKQPVQNFKDNLSNASYLRGQAVQQALHGEPSVQWRDTPNKQARIITASYPVKIKGEVVGAVAIEETSNAILILQNRAMEILINLSVITFLITLLVLLSYASRLSIRIRRLRDDAESAISNDGRVENSFTQTASSDEIGDLARSFNDMLSRLNEYNRYLETMAGKLSHELRTPITVVRSSLENLKSADSDSARDTYIKRASEGMARLSDILTRMSEATRLEQTLQSETLQKFDFCDLIENCIAGYEVAYPQVVFKFENKILNQAEMFGVPELVAQALDKLIANAVDFHKEATPVVIKITEKNNKLCLAIMNKGPLLPDDMRDNLFESMVSVRHKKTSQPHLGLGLYIVKMIVEFHQGSVQARNFRDGSGVEVLIGFPLDK